MSDLNSYATYYLERLKGAEWENAYRSLVEADHSIVPILINACQTEAEATTRATLVEIIGQHRVPEAIPFLAEALSDSHPQVWRSALDGFVALGDPAAVYVLESVRQRILAGSLTHSERIDWIDEAIQQIRDGLVA